MSTQADLTALTASINTKIDGIATDLTAAISDIKAQGTNIDLTALQAVSDKLTAFDATVKGDDPGAQATAPTDAPTPTK